MFEQPTKKTTESNRAEGNMSRRDFLKKSAQSLAGLALAGHVENVLGKGEIHKNTETKEYPEAKTMIEAETLMIDLLASNQGVFYGETHDGDPANEEFMIGNLEKFKQAGVKVLAMEMVDSEDQYLIDAYYSDPDKNKEALFQYTEGKLGRFPLIEAAQKVGIKVIGIDMKARHAGQPNWESIKREEVNEWWAYQVKKEMIHHASDEKYIVYGGFYHSRKDGTGVNNFLNVPSVIPINRNDYPKPFFALKEGTKVIPGRPKLGDYQRVYTQSFNAFCKENIKHYQKGNPEVAKMYQELDGLVSNFLESSQGDVVKRAHEVMSNLLPRVEEWDREYLVQLQGVIR